ncbi:hypothetical protein G5I_02652 [Acromyrmex echinatior]|uniref:Uncharacterized protein n=1 Tax=Acromyrmex echinatior TaxID=103372 RepID=F4WAV9_ACREC|nr:hypothetical protein G5I_02652 [Acromyrmex echinatior]
MQFLLYIFHQLPHGTQKRKIIMRPTQGSRSRRIDLQECKKAHQKLRGPMGSCAELAMDDSPTTVPNGRRVTNRQFAMQRLSCNDRTGKEVTAEGGVDGTTDAKSPGPTLAWARTLAVVLVGGLPSVHIGGGVLHNPVPSPGSGEELCRSAFRVGALSADTDMIRSGPMGSCAELAMDDSPTTVPNGRRVTNRQFAMQRLSCNDRTGKEVTAGGGVDGTTDAKSPGPTLAWARTLAVVLVGGLPSVHIGGGVLHNPVPSPGSGVCMSISTALPKKKGCMCNLQLAQEDFCINVLTTQIC